MKNCPSDLVKIRTVNQKGACSPIYFIHIIPPAKKLWVHTTLYQFPFFLNQLCHSSIPEGHMVVWIGGMGGPVGGGGEVYLLIKDFFLLLSSSSHDRFKKITAYDCASYNLTPLRMLATLWNMIQATVRSLFFSHLWLIFENLTKPLVELFFFTSGVSSVSFTRHITRQGYCIA